MNFKPSDFFIGIVEFFSVILPGSCVLYIVTREIIRPMDKLCETDSWIYYALSYTSLDI